MLNDNFTIEKREKKEYPAIPENVYPAELLDITSKEDETYDSKKARGKDLNLKPVMERIMSFQFTLLIGKDKDTELRGRNVWANFIPTYLYIGKNGKNKLYQIIEALQGKEIDQEQEATTSIDSTFLNLLIGKQCRIGIKHKETANGTFDNIDSYYKSDGDVTPLDDDEKEKARVKKKDEVKEINASEVINDEPIPITDDSEATQ